MLDGGEHWHNLVETLETSMYSGDVAFLLNYFDHLLLIAVVFTFYQQEGQHPLTGQRAANFRLLANQ